MRSARRTQVAWHHSSHSSWKHKTWSNFGNWGSGNVRVLILIHFSHCSAQRKSIWTPQTSIKMWKKKHSVPCLVVLIGQKPEIQEPQCPPALSWKWGPWHTNLARENKYSYRLYNPWRGGGSDIHQTIHFLLNIQRSNPTSSYCRSLLLSNFILLMPEINWIILMQILNHSSQSPFETKLRTSKIHLTIHSFTLHC